MPFLLWSCTAMRDSYPLEAGWLRIRQHETAFHPQRSGIAKLGTHFLS